MTSIADPDRFRAAAAAAVAHVPPARVLRRNLDPPPLRYAVVYGTGARGARRAAVLAGARRRSCSVTLRARPPRCSLVLIAAGWVLVRSLSALRGSVGVSWRYGIANIARRGRDSIIQIVAFGLGLDGAAAARRRAQRPHASVAREPAGQCAEPFHDQYPARCRPTAIREFFAQRAIAPPRAGADDPRAAHADQRHARGAARHDERARPRISSSARPT